MGMFDNVRCLYPLPWPAEELRDRDWQTKHTSAQFLDQYEIRADGTLWHEAYAPRVEEDATAPLGFLVHQENPHWEQVPWEGELEIHDCQYVPDGWIGYQVRFWLREGVVRDLIAKRTVHGREVPAKASPPGGFDEE